MHIRIFGDAPLPAWTQDPQFVTWAQSPVRHYNQEMERPCPEVPNDQAQQIFRDLGTLHEKTTQGAGAVIAWDLDLPDAVCFGWAGFRVWMGQKDKGELAIEIHWWSSEGHWVVTEPREANTILLMLSMVARNTVSLSNKKEFYAHFYLGDFLKCSLVHPPWSVDRMYLTGGLGVFLDENGNLDDIQHLQRWGEHPDILGVVRWLGRCLRRAARRWPGFYLLGVALHEQSGSVRAVPWVNNMLGSLNADPTWIEHPWLWMAMTREPIQSQGPLTVPKAQGFSRGHTQTQSHLPYLMDEETANLNMMGARWMGPRTQQWAQERSLGQTWRFFRQLRVHSNLETLRFPCALVMDLLAGLGKNMVSGARLNVLLLAPPVFIRWLVDCSEWRSGQGPWHVANYHLTDLAPNHPELALLSSARDLHDHNQAAFEAVGRTADLLAETRVSRRGKSAWQTAGEDRIVSEQLINKDLRPWLDWQALASAQDWEQVHDLVVRAERRALQPVLDGVVNIQDEEFATQLRGTQTQLGGFHTTRFVSWVSQEPELIGWRDQEGNSLLDWIHEHAQGNDLNEDDILWLAQKAPKLLTNVTSGGTTLERLSMSDEFRATIKRLLLGEVAGDYPETQEVLPRM